MRILRKIASEEELFGNHFIVHLAGENLVSSSKYSIFVN